MSYEKESLNQVDAVTTSDQPDQADNILLFRSRSDATPAQNLQEFIRHSQQQFDVWQAPGLEWDSWKWEGIGSFSKLGVHVGTRTSLDPSLLMDTGFINFSRAYLTHLKAENPRLARSVSLLGLKALRSCEQGLLQMAGHSSIDMLKLDRSAMDAAAEAAQRHFASANDYYHVGKALQKLARFISKERLVSPKAALGLAEWATPIPPPKSLGKTLDEEGMSHRKNRLPSAEVIEAIAEIFCKPDSKLSPRDIYTTSMCVFLLTAPMRGGDELHGLKVSAKLKDFDENGAEQSALRTVSGKGFGTALKWFWHPEWFSVFDKAYDRIKRLTDDGRRLAKHLEDPATRDKFYRHSNCPQVPDDLPLTAAQVCQALGFKKIGFLETTNPKLSQENGRYTLNELQQIWVLPSLPKGFPWILDTKGEKLVKYSEALLCMRKFELYPSSVTTCPVKLMAPNLATLNNDLGDFSNRTSLFERHLINGPDGQPLKVSSHAFRHFLNDQSRRGGLTEYEIALWSGRRKKAQNRAYDHITERERFEQVQEMLTVNGEFKGVVNPSSAVAQLEEKKKRGVIPIKPSEIAFDEAGAMHSTPWGVCVHDFNMSVCQSFGQCIACTDHRCLKGAGATDQERLMRLKGLLPVKEMAFQSAKRRFDEGKSMNKKWVEMQWTALVTLKQLVQILEDPNVPDGSVIRLTHRSQSHMSRVLRSSTHKSLEAGDLSPDSASDVLALLDGRKPTVEVRSPDGNVHLLMGHDSMEGASSAL